MAVEDKYVNANIVAGIPARAHENPGGLLKMLFQNAAIAAADDDGSKYRLFKAVPSNIIIQEIWFGTDGITGGTDYEFGIYETDLGAVISKGVFMTGQTMAVASAMALNGFAAVANVDMGKKLFEHAGHTEITKKSSYDLVLTADTVGTAAGNVTGRILYIEG